MSRGPRQHAFEPTAVPELAAYISRCTGGRMDADWASIVLDRFIAGPEAVCDLWVDGARAGVAVSLDTCDTEGNAAELSVFSASPADPVLAALLEWGETRAAAAGRSHVDIPAWPGTPLPAALLEARGYRVGHVMYDMKRPVDAPAPPAPPTPLPDGWRWQTVDAATVDAYHATVTAAFARIPSAFVQPLAPFRERVLAANPRPALIASTDADCPVAAFLRIEPRSDGAGALASLGRHPRYRGRGLGAHLVARGIQWLGELGIRDVRLEVAAGNAAGVALYTSFGFEVSGSMSVFRRPV